MRDLYLSINKAFGQTGHPAYRTIAIEEEGRIEATAAYLCLYRRGFDYIYPELLKKLKRKLLVYEETT